MARPFAEDSNGRRFVHFLAAYVMPAAGSSAPGALDGLCQCGAVAFVLSEAPLFVHACHCLSCQRRTGSAFGITTIVLETSFISRTGTLVDRTVSAVRCERVCAECGQWILSTASNHPATALVNAGAFRDPRRLKIGAHIWVSRKHDWIVLPPDVPQFAKNYARETTWPEHARARLAAAM